MDDASVKVIRPIIQTQLGACPLCEVRWSIHPSPGPGACREAELRERALDYQ
jgi:hypothetical protein